jgi:type III secretory pathway component EscT
VNQWDKWYNNQNDATRAGLDAQAKEDNKLILISVLCGILIGFVFSTLLWL